MLCHCFSDPVCFSRLRWIARNPHLPPSRLTHSLFHQHIRFHLLVFKKSDHVRWKKLGRSNGPRPIMRTLLHLWRDLFLSARGSQTTLPNLCPKTLSCSHHRPRGPSLELAKPGRSSLKALLPPHYLVILDFSSPSTYLFPLSPSCITPTTLHTNIGDSPSTFDESLFISNCNFRTQSLSCQPFHICFGVVSSSKRLPKHRVGIPSSESLVHDVLAATWSRSWPFAGVSSTNWPRDTFRR